MKSHTKLLLLWTFLVIAACPVMASENAMAQDKNGPYEDRDYADNGDAMNDIGPPVEKPSYIPPAITDKAPEEARELPQDKAVPDMPTDDFTLIAGDVLQITVWKEDGLDREILVLPDGTITFPLIGTLQAQGLSPQMLQASIKDKLRKLIPDASVTVMVKAPLGHTVSVLGQVTKPGEIVMARHIGVMEALSQVGGLTPYANTSHIVILRYVDGKKTSIRFPYDDVAEGLHPEKDIDLKPGDVVVVPTAGLL
jgi:polysaccharide export outer membrane protein